MTETVLQPVRLSPVPWRAIAVLALLSLALVAGIALTAGNNRPAVPAPFGLAGNGLVAYASAGDIFTVDPVTGARRAVVSGMDLDGDPRWSPDGRRLAFLRSEGSDGVTRLVIVDANGGNPITSIGGIDDPDPDSIAWAPDGSSVAVAGNAGGRRIFLVDSADGSLTKIGAGYTGLEFFWRPPDGRQLLFSGRGADGPALLLYTLDGREVQELPVALAPGQQDVRPIGWTADGARYGYQLETGLPDRLATRVVEVETGAHVDVPVAFGHFSNDGTRIAGLDAEAQGHPCVAPLARGDCRRIGTIGTAPYDTTWAALYWSPDDRWIVTRPQGSSAAHLLDPDGTVVDQPGWLAEGAESWQRVP